MTAEVTIFRHSFLADFVGLAMTLSLRSLRLMADLRTDGEGALAVLVNEKVWRHGAGVGLLDILHFS